jgi:Acetyltransferase (GNAT) domain
VQLRPYQPGDEPAWERLCAQAPNASFLHRRGFLSYHGNRFIDRSVVLLDGERWLGVLPAAQHPATPERVESHPGITYGGFVHHGELRGERLIEAMQLAALHYAGLGHRQFRYKPLPHIYHQTPMQDDLYALFRLGATRVRCELSACIDLAQPRPPSERRRRALAKARRAGLRCESGPSHTSALWRVLEENLQRKHASQPVHTLAEIELLAARFAQQIGVHVVLHGEQVLAGVVSFTVGPVWHLQYIASSEAGQAVSALDALMAELLAQAREAGYRYFDFGTSNEDQGRVLNEGLYRFKCEFGAGGVACETYQIELAG